MAVYGGPWSKAFVVSNGVGITTTSTTGSVMILDESIVISIKLGCFGDIQSTCACHFQVCWLAYEKLTQAGWHLHMVHIPAEYQQNDHEEIETVNSGLRISALISRCFPDMSSSQHSLPSCVGGWMARTLRIPKTRCLCRFQHGGRPDDFGARLWTMVTSGDWWLYDG